jgi:FlaA1/EpsC-like NDP-sugar epimerase
LLCQTFRSTTRFVTVRFGNVVDSSGSVIPIFREQIARGGPVTVTHPDMVRYFMTITEAAQLVIQAGAMGLGGEVFILDMGDPVRIVDLAHDMIRLAHRPAEDIAIVMSGIRRGEKLAEELATQQERVDQTRHPKILIGHQATPPPPDLAARIDRLLAIADTADDGTLRAALSGIVPEYRPVAAPR